MAGPWPQDRVQLGEAHCDFGVDRVPGRDDVTAFKQRARRHQAWWREERGLPIGTHRSGRPPTDKLNGSRIDFEHARATSCNFLSPAIVAAVHHRLEHPQPHQTLNAERLWSDLLSSMPMCFNLFGELASDPARLASAADALWPGHPGAPADVLFEWSPGRRDHRYLNNRSAFDAAVLFELKDGKRAALGIETKYHEDIRIERPPSDARLARYTEVTETSKVFAKGWKAQLVGTDLQQFWLDHLLALSMLQHPDGLWDAARFMVVYPAANPSVADAVARYREVLSHDSTFDARTLEELLDTHTLHAPDTEAAFRQRYLW